jgi:hypothetical protein
MVRFGNHYFLQKCDVGKIQEGEPGALLENCYFHLRAAKTQEGGASEAFSGMVTAWPETAALAAGQFAAPIRSRLVALKLHCKTTGDEPERFFADLSLAFEPPPLILGWSHAGVAFKERGETPQTVKPHRKARIRHRHFLLQQILCPLDAHMRQVLMGRPAINALERADKMILRITRLIRDFTRIDPLGKIAVNEQLCLDDPELQV